MSEILKTTDYSIFKKCEVNRELDHANLNRVLASIRARNMLNLRPILVNKNMEIIDGQHRLEVARKLGVEIYYQIDQEASEEDIIMLNANQARWQLADYINFYAKKGKESYVRFQNFCKKNNVTFDLARKLMGKDGGESSVKIKSGTFLFSQESEEAVLLDLFQIEKVMAVIRRCTIKKEKFLDSPKFKHSLAVFMKKEGVDFDTMMRKIEMNVDALHMCPNTPLYMEMFKRIYNYRNQNPVL